MGKTITGPSKMKIEKILQHYEIEGKLTMRRIYYILLGYGLVSSADSAYDTLCKNCVNWREKGLIPEGIIEDRHRLFIKRHTHKDFDAAFEWLCDNFSRDSMAHQEKYVEVWIEKDTMAGKFEVDCYFNDVPLIVSKGFTSYTFKIEAVQRFKEQGQKSIVILYFGDFDAEGEYIPFLMREFVNEKLPAASFELKKVLLTEKDKEKLKEFAVRYSPKKGQLKKGYVQDFISKHGKIKIEVEALSFAEIKDRFLKALWKEIDEDIIEQNKSLSMQDLEGWIERHYRE